MKEWARSVVTEWDATGFEGGVEGLHALTTSDFTGVVESGPQQVYMLNGRVVGHEGGALADIGADGTAYHAPDPGAPLLFAMLERDHETEERYYTEEVSLRDVHDTLAEGSFTGYIELAENVLSGDYYIVYYGGRSLPVAFVGSSRRLITGDEAFERAADEVGIFEVRAVDVSVTEVPPVPESSPPDDAVESTDSSDPSTADNDIESAADASETPEEPEPESERIDEEAAVETEESSEEAPSPPAQNPTSAPSNDPSSEATTEQVADTAGPNTNRVWRAASSGTEGQPVGADELQVQAIPSIDPAKTDSTVMTPSESTTEEDSESSAAEESESHQPETEELEARLAALEAEREELREERDTLAAEVEALEAELEEVQTRQEPTETEPTSGDADTSLEAKAALADSHLFVRYRTRSENTLESAIAEGSDAEAVRDNLLLERHTNFDAAEVTVGDESFETFFEDRLEVRFIRWVLEELLFEIAETNSRARLADLVEAIESVDRVDFQEPVEGLEDHRFDVVARDRVGNPVIVADVDPGRSATPQAVLTDLVTATSEAAVAADTIGAAMLVTESFFDPGALEAAEEATNAGLLNRSDKAAYVRVSRGTGYHLCLIECREETFHLTSPTL